MSSHTLNGAFPYRAFDSRTVRCVNVLADGRFLVGTSRLVWRTIFRPAFSNWRARFEDIDEFVAVVQELGAMLKNG